MRHASLTASLLSTSMVATLKPICQSHNLQVHVYHLAAEPVSYQNTTNLSFSPTSFTLISGQRDAILVDAPATIVQGKTISSWISETIPDKTLRGIYITHGHGDHFFASDQIKAEHPEAKVIATEGTAEHMAEQYTLPFWDVLFPGKLSHALITPDIVLPSDGTFHLEGHVLRGIEVGQGDAWKSTVLHVPDLDLVVGGDVVYGNCHQLFAETNTRELRAQWLNSLDRVAALNPKVVVPSHQTEEDGHSPGHVGRTQEYIRYYEEALAETRDWEQLETMLRTRWPDRDGSFILRWTSQAPFGAAF